MSPAGTRTRARPTRVTAGTRPRRAASHAPRPATAASSARAAGRRGWWWRAAAFVALVAVGLLLGLVFGEPGSAARTGPLSEQEVRDVAYAFADAYARRGSGRAAGDARAQRGADGAGRCEPRPRPGGRPVQPPVRRQGRRLRARHLEVQAGRGGRASGTYHVERDSGDPYDGSIVFGVVRERGEPRIALIAATPSSSWSAALRDLDVHGRAAPHLVPASGSCSQTAGSPGSSSSISPPRLVDLRAQPGLGQLVLDLLPPPARRDRAPRRAARASRGTRSSPCPARARWRSRRSRSGPARAPPSHGRSRRSPPPACPSRAPARRRAPPCPARRPSRLRTTASVVGLVHGEPHRRERPLRPLVVRHRRSRRRRDRRG